MATIVATLEANQFISASREMISVVAELVNSLTIAHNTVQRMENTLLTSAGTIGQARRDISDLREITDDLGVSLEAAVTPFAKFAAAASELSRSETFEVFEGFATALSATHASAEKVQGTFLALQQIVSKGKVNMQDLRRQLAEHIPGAMELARQAFGDGTASMEEFEDAVSSGAVEMIPWIKKFGQLMKENFGDAAARAAASLEGEMNRLNTANLVFKNQIVEVSGAAEAWKEVLVNIREEVFNNTTTQESLAIALGKTNEAVVWGSEQLGEYARIAAQTVAALAIFGEKLVENNTALDSYTNVLGLTIKAHQLAMKWLDWRTEGLIESEAAQIKLNKATRLNREALDALAKAEKEYTQEVDNSSEKWDERREKLEKEIETINWVAKAHAIGLEEMQELDKAAVEGAKKRAEAMKDMYQQTGIASEEFLESERERLTELAESWSAWMTEAERLDFVNEEMEKIVANTKEAKEEAARLAEEEKKAAEEAERLQKAAEKLKKDYQEAADAAAKLAEENKKAAEEEEARQKKQDEADEKKETEAKRKGSEENPINSYYDASGGLTDEEWQSLEPWQQDALLAMGTQGSSYDYFNNTSGNRFRGGVDPESRAIGQEMAAQFYFSFNQSMSRSDVTSIVEETLRISERT